MVRTIFMGTADFALPILEALSVLREITLVAVYTEPDKPKGRGLRTQGSPVKTWSEKHHLPIEQPPGFRKDPAHLHKLGSYKPDLVVVAAYGKILPKDLIDIPRYGCVNVHPSPLPKYRGPSPIQAALLHSDTATALTLMQIDEGMDTGPIISQESFAISPEDDFTSLASKLALLGAEMIMHDFPRYLNGELTPKPQPSRGVSITKLIEKTDGEIDWVNDSPATILGKVRAFTPWPGTYTFLTDGKRLIITKAHLVNSHPGGESTQQLIIDRLKVEGKPEMDFSAFLRGYRGRLPSAMQSALGFDSRSHS